MADTVEQVVQQGKREAGQHDLTGQRRQLTMKGVVAPAVSGNAMQPPRHPERTQRKCHASAAVNDGQDGRQLRSVDLQMR
jgi:hypothetical protein